MAGWIERILRAISKPGKPPSDAEARAAAQAWARVAIEQQDYRALVDAFSSPSKDIARFMVAQEQLTELLHGVIVDAWTRTRDTEVVDPTERRRLSREAVATASAPIVQVIIGALPAMPSGYGKDRLALLLCKPSLLSQVGPVLKAMVERGEFGDDVGAEFEAISLPAEWATQLHDREAYGELAAIFTADTPTVSQAHSSTESFAESGTWQRGFSARLVRRHCRR